MIAPRASGEARVREVPVGRFLLAVGIAMGSRASEMSTRVVLPTVYSYSNSSALVCNNNKKAKRVLGLLVLVRTSVRDRMVMWSEFSSVGTD